MRARVLLFQLLAVVAMLLATASASARVETQTRVRAVDSMLATCIELEAGRTLEHRPTNRFDGPTNAADSCVAAEGAGSAGMRAPGFIYRGVHAGHPAMDAALEGRVVPGNLAGTASAEAHNLGGVAADSPFTSWTHDFDVAAQHAAKNGPGGVILRVPQGAPPPGASWSWEWSPDVYGEQEVLMRGFRNGVQVFRW